MAVPTVITELSATAASNSPADTEQRTTADDYLRALGAFIRQNYDVLVGGQFTFPSTQNASSNANCLDDYEEGTWTPAIAFNDVTTGITYAAQTGRYTKIGRLVLCNGSFLLTSKGAATGNAIISGLPFPNATTTAAPVASMGYYYTFVGLTGAITGFIASASSAISLVQTGATGTTDVTDANFADASEMSFSIAYMV